MTAQGEDVLAWTLKAITSAEVDASNATSGVCPEWIYSAVRHIARNCIVECSHADHQDIDQPEWDRYNDWSHLVRQGPEAVLRRCAADRRLLELHAPQQDGSPFPEAMQCHTCSTAPGDGYQYLVPFPCLTVLAIAEGYGWAEGER